MSKTSTEDAVYAALQAVKSVPRSTEPSTSLAGGLNFESIDVIDLFFEIEQSTGVIIELNQLIGKMQRASGRRFEDISIQDLIDYLQARGK